ncbi:MAG: OsmC family protein, partial [Ilumatobacteraceae bacterium]
AIDVDLITSKRSEPLRFDVSMTANKVRDEHGNHLVNLAMTFDVTFPDDEGGRAAAGVLPDAITRSHARVCTVGRTVEIGTPVTTAIADDR